jgi:4'-phosphopantetheinyl transferase
MASGPHDLGVQAEMEEFLDSFRGNAIFKSGPALAERVAQGAPLLVTSRLDVGEEEVRASEALLSEDERKRASRFVFDRDKRRFVVARAGLRKLLAHQLRLDPSSVELKYSSTGKPALGDQSAIADLRFNVSHSEDVAVFAFALGRDIGIDVEFVRAIPDADGIAARFFSLRENEAYFALDARDRPQGFFNCWTRKEAFIKAIGDGLSHPLDRFDVSLAPRDPARILSVDGVPGEDCGWMVHSFFPSPGFVAAVVTQTSIDDRLKTLGQAPDVAMVN